MEIKGGFDSSDPQKMRVLLEKHYGKEATEEMIKLAEVKKDGDK